MCSFVGLASCAMTNLLVLPTVLDTDAAGGCCCAANAGPDDVYSDVRPRARLANSRSGLDHGAMSDAVVQWLIEGDPSVRWQAERDLLARSPRTWRSTRAAVANEGWGRRFLDQQDPGGTWGGGLYTPKWTSTTYTLTLLRRLGMPPSNQKAIAGCRRLLDDALWFDGGVSFWASHEYAERCVNGMVLAVASHFNVADRRIDSIAEVLVGAVMPDGGWNCQDVRGATHSSFHTTISVLEGLLEWKRSTGSSEADTVIAGGHEFLLKHWMYRSHRTGEVIRDVWTTFHFPPRWHYDVLRGLDHLRDAEAMPDPRASDGIGLVRGARRPDGRWGKGSQYSGVTYFPLEPGRVAGRWNTLRALRVLRWWEKT